MEPEEQNPALQDVHYLVVSHDKQFAEIQFRYRYNVFIILTTILELFMLNLAS